jgi:hypothetical protein
MRRSLEIYLRLGAAFAGVICMGQSPPLITMPSEATVTIHGREFKALDLVMQPAAPELEALPRPCSLLEPRNQNRGIQIPRQSMLGLQEAWLCQTAKPNTRSHILAPELLY